MANAYGTGSGVSFQRADYTEANEEWTTVDDCIDGQSAIKKKSTVYLPNPSPADISSAALARYNAYLVRSVFYNYTARTSEGMIGTSFAKGITFEGPTELDYLLEDVNGTSEDLSQQSKRALAGTAAHGRYGLLAEFPTVDGVKSKADQQKLGIRATIQAYKATSIINWGYEKVGAEVKLSLVVLYETITQKVEGNDFELELINQWRVLKLVDGLYVQEIWQSKATTVDQTTNNNTVAGENNDAKLISTFQPRLGNGTRLDYIPFQFIGSLNNDGVIDKSLLIDIANINIAHYHNSADYENSTFQCSQSQPTMTGLTQTWIDDNYPNGVTLGSGVVLMGPEGFEYSVVQASETEQSMRAMEHKEKQIIAIGGQLITPDSFNTATEAAISNAADRSALQTVIDNVQDGYQTVLGWVSEFMNAPGDIEFTINSNLSEVMATPQMVQAVVQAWQGQAIGLEDKNQWFRRAGLTDRTDEEIAEDIDNDISGLLDNVEATVTDNNGE